MARSSSGSRSGTGPQALTSGPFKGVRDLLDPFSVPKNYLKHAVNLFLPDPKAGCSAYGRPGCSLANSDEPFGELADGRVVQAIATVTTQEGVTLNFTVVGGKVFRVTPGFASWEDVTPEDIDIDPENRVYLTEFSNRLLVNDDVNPPWVMSDLTASPVTATLITYSTAAGTDWIAFGPARVYQGTAFWIVRSAGSEERTSRIAWSEVDDPILGYKQDDFDNEWDLVENGTTPVNALWGVNNALYYWREGAIGYFSGTIGDDFRTTATHDAIDEGTGTRSPASIQQFGNWVYFVDTEGKAQRFAVGGELQDLSLQHRRIITTQLTRHPEVTAQTACAVIVPDLDIYLAAIWSPDPTAESLARPWTLYAWHAPTGTYLGEWRIGMAEFPIVVHALGVHIGTQNQSVLVIGGTKTANDQSAGAGGYFWQLSQLDEDLWTDNGHIPELKARTGRLGYAANAQWNVDRVLAVVSPLPEGTPDCLLVITPSSFTLAIGETQQLTVTLYKFGIATEIDADLFEWTSSDESIATVSQTGLVTGVGGTGATTITASLPDTLDLGLCPAIVSNNVSVDVTPVCVLTIAPAEFELIAGETQQLTPTLTRNGIEVTLTPELLALLTWEQLTGETAAEIDEAGLVTGLGNGTATFRATLADTLEDDVCPMVVSNEAEATVTAAPASIELTPVTMDLLLGGTDTVTAVVKDSLGNVLTGFAVTFETDDALTADIASATDLTGTVSGVALGTTSVRAQLAAYALTSNDCVVTVYDNYILHSFPSGTWAFNVSAGAATVRRLIIGAGAGGGGVFGYGVGSGAGGGGEVIDDTYAVAVGSYVVVVGGTLAPPVVNALFTIADGYGGDDSSFDGDTAQGGGSGSAVFAGGGPGGSGGGARSDNGGNPGHTGGASTATPPGVGNIGGAGVNNDGDARGGGGGGAGTPGTDTPAGTGGDGIASDITGASVDYAGGGGGANATKTGAAGGLGGGGRGGSNGGGTDYLGGDGTAPGAGGGGGRGANGAGTPVSGQGGRGADGAVKVRYRESDGLVATGGTITTFPV